MESFALTLFVLCACTGLLTVGLLARWLRIQALPSPDPDLDSIPPRPLSELGETALITTGRASPGDDDATQPMAHTQTNWAHSAEWPSTQSADTNFETVPTTEPYLSEFPDTEPMPIDLAHGR